MCIYISFYNFKLIRSSFKHVFNVVNVFLRNTVMSEKIVYLKNM